jgi:hypothetical protein
MSLVEEIRAILDAAGIRHALIGALALSAYGVNRATLDLDLFAADASCLEAAPRCLRQKSGLRLGSPQNLSPKTRQSVHLRPAVPRSPR